MTRGIRLVVVGLAVAVNGAALATVHSAMGQIHERQKLALQQPVRIVVVGQRSEHVAIQNCPAPTPKVL
jgi:hypothetical protein